MDLDRICQISFGKIQKKNSKTNIQIRLKIKQVCFEMEEK